MNFYEVLAVWLALRIYHMVNTNNAPGEGANIVPKTMNFVEVVKKDLLRNNDDYIERANKTKANASSTLIDKKVTSAKNLPVSSVTNALEKQESKSYRRMYDNSSSEYDYIYTPTTTKKTTPKPNKTNTDAKSMKSTKQPNVNEIVLKTLKSSTRKTSQDKALRSIPKFVDKNKIDKFKRFMEKNKELFKEYMNRSRQGTKGSVTPVVPTVTNNNDRQQWPTTVANNIGRQQWVSSVLALRHHQDTSGAVARQGVTQGLLPRDMLDMLPAKGGRVYKQRRKGRLCHRHVLMPEGPKYDSAGRWYLAAHPPSAPRAYARTRRPHLLLPRCCNCCKKSVLGCE